MSRSKENNYSHLKSNYIRFLYNEAQRHGADKNPNLYSEILKFVNSPQGQKGLQTFSYLDSSRFGFKETHISSNIKRIFSS